MASVIDVNEPCPRCSHALWEHGRYSCCHINEATNLCDCPCLLSRTDVLTAVTGVEVSK